MARRQEQENARPDVTEVAPDILRMELPIQMPGLGHVNCYAIVDKNGAAVVDPGLPGPGTWRALQDRLKQIGLAPRHVHTVIVTHSHPDHFGGAARFAKESGADVVAHHSFSFGVSTPAHAAEIARYADGVVVGSAIVDRIEAAGSRDEAVDAVAHFVREMKKALRRQRAATR